jgi:hypothetical protein
MALGFEIIFVVRSFLREPGGFFAERKQWFMMEWLFEFSFPSMGRSGSFLHSCFCVWSSMCVGIIFSVSLIESLASPLLSKGESSSLFFLREGISDFFSTFLLWRYAAKQSERDVKCRV